MKAKTIATLAVIAAQQALTQATPKSHSNDVDNLSLEELLELRESILEAKQNLTYYIEESDDDEDDEMNEFGNEEEQDSDGDSDSDDDDYDDSDGSSDDENKTNTEFDFGSIEDVQKTAKGLNKKEPSSTDQYLDSKKETPMTTENLLALRQDLIAEINEHMMQNGSNMNTQLTHEQEMKQKNLTYDLAEGHNITLKGSMLNEMSSDDEEGENIEDYLDDYLLALMQQQAQFSNQSQAMVANPQQVQQQLDTNVMYDPASGEGLVCVNGRCISNKRKFQVHDENQMGLNSQGRRRREPPSRRKRIRPRHNGIPMNPYENDISGNDSDDEDLVPFEEHDELLNENFRDGKIYNYSGNKPQEPKKPKKGQNQNMRRFSEQELQNSAENEPFVRKESDIVKTGPITSQLGNKRPSFKPGEPFSFSTANNRSNGMDFGEYGPQHQQIDYIAPIDLGDEEQEQNMPHTVYPLPSRANPYGDQAQAHQNSASQQSPMVSFDTGSQRDQLSQIASNYGTSSKSKKNARKETEFPALFCDEGDCTLGQSHTGVACVWNNCVSTFGEEMSAEMCEGEDCQETTENILCVDDYCHVIEAEFIGFRGVPCAGGVCGYELGISICNVDKCTFTSEDGLSFGHGPIDINGVSRPCDDDPILCAGLLCACVDPTQHFETDLLGMQSDATLDCQDGKCQVNSQTYTEPESNQMENNIFEDPYAAEAFNDEIDALNPSGYDPASYNENGQYFNKPSGASTNFMATMMLCTFSSIVIQLL